MEIDRQLARAMTLQERPHPSGGAIVEIAFGGDPFAAAVAAGIGFAFGEIDLQRHLKSGRSLLRFLPFLPAQLGTGASGARKRNDHRKQRHQPAYHAPSPANPRLSH